MPSLKPDEMIERLTRYIAAEGSFSEVKIENLRRMPGGASREIWSFDAELKKDSRSRRKRLVLRRDPGPTKIETSRREEFLVLKVAYKTGVPVPEVMWLGENPEVLGARFFIMERIDGETIARRLLRDEQYATARDAMPEQLASILARIHTIDYRKHGLDFLPEPDGSAARGEVLRYQDTFRKIALEPHPAFELAFRWLLERVPKSPRRVLVHGDYRIGNVIFGPEGVRSILDWELAHIGDPMEDIGWMCVRAWRFGEDRKPVGGLCDRERFFKAYENASGMTVDREAAKFWELFGNLRWES